ncbi:Rne/Rng family ribonuclease [Neisseriaceae bacterium TC5R-5]|nr:Rne/Rng family ribonuclease [Neisseriaceae bacterium TC5R-5]
MKRMLFNATQAEELRVAIVDGQKLIDLDIETVGKEQRKGNIYKGIITRIEPSLEACFVDYGTERHGFLPFKEVARSYFQGYEGGRPRIQEVLREGMEVVVQVEKDERGNKGAALTTYISLAGRYLVLMPNNPRGGGVSRRIEGEERQELKDLLGQLDVPTGMSLIARTAGIGRGLEELQWDLGYLMQLWRAIEGAASKQSAPFLILQEGSLVIRAIRDYFQPDIGEVLIDTDEIHDQAKQFMAHVMPHMLSRVKAYKDHVPLFSRFQIEHQIETAFSRSVQLPSGGAIVIDHTEALVSIDVNSARATKGADIEDTAVRTNLEAAEEIARQLRLRDLGGLVVIDFIDMENTKNQRDVENKLRDVLKYDRARVQMGKLSRFGLLELSRQRLQPSLGETSHQPCPRCHGIGFIRGIESSALHILRIIQEEAMKENTGAVHAQVPVDVATFLLNEKRAEIHSVEERLDVDVVLIPNIHLETPHYKIVRVRHDDLAEAGEAPSYLRVEVQEEDVTTNFGQEKPKLERPEAAVKDFTPQRAPDAKVVPAAVEAGLLERVVAWVKGLFAEPEVVAPVESKKPAHSSSRGNRQRQNDRRSGGQARREHEQRRQDTSTAEEAGKRRQPLERNDRSERQEGRKDAAVREERSEPLARNSRRREREPRESREVREPRQPAVAAREESPRAEPNGAERTDNRARNEGRRRQPQAALDMEKPQAEPALSVEAEQQERHESRRRRGGRRDRRRDGDEGTGIAQANVASAAVSMEQEAIQLSPVEDIKLETSVPSIVLSTPVLPDQVEALLVVEPVQEVVTPPLVVKPLSEVAAVESVDVVRATWIEPATTVVIAQPEQMPALEQPVVPAFSYVEPEHNESNFNVAPTYAEPSTLEELFASVPAPQPIAPEPLIEPEAVPVVAFVSPAAVVEEPVVLVSEAPKVTEAEPIELGGLIMVATKPHIEISEPELPALSAGPRRKDLRTAGLAHEAATPASLVQIETRHS